VPDLALTTEHIGQACRARIAGRFVKATLHQIKPKGLVLRLFDGAHVNIRLAQLLSIDEPHRTLAPCTEPDQVSSAFRVVFHSQPPPSEPRPKTPRIVSINFLAYVRTLPCCNCQTTSPSDPHHEGRRGVGQKAHDVLAVPLCRPCHSIYTDTNCLPDPQAKLRSREQSLHILQTTQRDLLLCLLHRLELPVLIDCLAHALNHAQITNKLTPALLKTLDP